MYTYYIIYIDLGIIVPIKQSYTALPMQCTIPTLLYILAINHADK